MREENHESMNRRSHDAKPVSKNDGLDRALDAALVKYAAVEPRAGLEERILANLRANGSEQASTGRTGWLSQWQWNAVAIAVAAVVIVAIALAVRSGSPARPVIANHPSTTQPGPTPTPQVENHNASAVSPRTITPRKAAPLRRTVPHPAQTVVAANPKLDQFPSPQPLSEQEKILESYAAKYPEQAALIAQARMKVLREDELEEMREAEKDRDPGSEKARQPQSAAH
jgi:hypothetical protein